VNSGLPIRTLQLATAALVVVLLGWATWPRATRIEVSPGGVAHIVDRWSRRSPLGDTLYLDANADGKLRIVNHDTLTHRLGPFPVKAGETVEFAVPQRGAYTAVCTVHKRGQLTYIVR
jgi:hypothetical protein